MNPETSESCRNDETLETGESCRNDETLETGEAGPTVEENKRDPVQKETEKELSKESINEQTSTPKTGEESGKTETKMIDRDLTDFLWLDRKHDSWKSDLSKEVKATKAEIKKLKKMIREGRVPSEKRQEDQSQYRIN